MKINSYNGISVGSIITAYHSGYHKVTGFEDRSYPIDSAGNMKQSLLVEYIKVANADGKKSRKIKNNCHIDYCKVVKPYDIEVDYQNSIQKAQMKKINLLKLLENS